jgi:hypothetical protein
MDFDTRPIVTTGKALPRRQDQLLVSEETQGALRVRQAEMALSDLSYGVHSVRRSTFTPDQIERLKALRDDLTTIIEREER